MGVTSSSIEKIETLYKHRTSSISGNTTGSSAENNNNSSNRSSSSSSSMGGRLSQHVAAIHFDTLEEAKAAISAKYHCGQIIGRGASADVYLMTHRETQKQYACKMIAKNNKLNDDKTMQMETYLLQHVQHEHLVNLHELYECPDHVWLVMEYADVGDLWHGLASIESEEYTEGKVAELFEQLLLGVKYLHAHRIVHRDLKLENVLLASSPQKKDSFVVKIADMGLSTQITTESLKKQQAETEAKKQQQKQKKGGSSSRLLPKVSLSLKSKLPDVTKYTEEELVYTNKRLKALNQMWGTTAYFAPEIYQRGYGYQADIWALGCILYEMLTGELAFPYREEKQLDFMDRVLLHGGQTPKRMFELKETYKCLSEVAKDLIAGMLHTNPKKRLNIDECLSHPFFAQQKQQQQQQQAKVGLSGAHRLIVLKVQRSNKRQEQLVKEMELKMMKLQQQLHLQQQHQHQQQSVSSSSASPSSAAKRVDMSCTMSMESVHSM